MYNGHRHFYNSPDPLTLAVPGNEAVQSRLFPLLAKSEDRPSCVRVTDDVLDVLTKRVHDATQWAYRWAHYRQRAISEAIVSDFCVSVVGALLLQSSPPPPQLPP